MLTHWNKSQQRSFRTPSHQASMQQNNNLRKSCLLPDILVVVFPVWTCSAATLQTRSLGEEIPEPACVKTEYSPCFMSVSSTAQTRTLHLMARLVLRTTCYHQTLSLSYIGEEHWGDSGRVYPAGLEIRNIVHWASEEWKEALDMCVSSGKNWALRLKGREKKKEEDVQGTHKWANLKFRRASGQGFGATLHWCSVAMNKRRGWSRWAYVGKHSSKTTALFFLGKKVSMASTVGEKRLKSSRIILFFLLRTGCRSLYWAPAMIAPSD